MSINVWKIGSRWSDTGTKESSIIDIFRKYQIVFLGDKTVRFENEVKIGDFIAIADGINVSTVAKVISEPKRITDFGIEFTEAEKCRFGYESNVIGAKVHIVELKEKIVSTRGTFFKANAIRNQVIEKYNENLSRFEIKASTKKIQDILISNSKYIIPIYQRPYSWTKDHIDKLLNDLFIGYYNTGVKTFEDVFIGTMQLSFPKIISKNLNEIEIIDGQQRISTFLLLIKVIQLKTENDIIKALPINWLSTEVNNNTQDADLQILINIINIGQLKEHTSNTYIKNAFYINQKIEELFDKDDLNENQISFDDFLLKYIFKKVCFVVIETQAPLSKTLKIFDSINTTGMDLGGNDIFKIRFYEYLTNFKNEDKKVFEQISTLYSRIDEINKDGWKFGIYDILSNYQWILISKYGMSKTLYNYNANTFFEQLFDVILKINNHNNFDGAKIFAENIEISIDELELLIENRNRRESEKDMSIEITCANHLIAHWSRYGKYWQLIMLFYYSFSKTQNFEEKLKEFANELQKTLVVYSVIYDKAINEIHSFIRDLVDVMVKENSRDYDELIFRLNNKRKEKQAQYITQINNDIFYNAKKKNLICRTSALIDEIQCNLHQKPEELGKKIFMLPIDIEHIHSRGDISNSKEKLDLWGYEMNSLGNLTILESGLNKSISNNSFHKKLPEYDKRSNYEIVRNLVRLSKGINEWTLDMAIKRKETEVEKLRKYYFD